MCVLLISIGGQLRGGVIVGSPLPPLPGLSIRQSSQRRRDSTALGSLRAAMVLGFDRYTYTAVGGPVFAASTCAIPMRLLVASLHR